MGFVRCALWQLGLAGGAEAISNRPALGGVYHKIRRLRNVVLGKIALLQRHPPSGKIGISLPLPCLQAAGLLFFCAGQEHPQRFVTGQQRVVAVAALQNHQRLRGQLPRGQVRTLAAGIGTVLHRLALVGWAQGFVPQAGKVHIGAGRFLPAADALCRRQVKIIGVQGDAGRELPGQRICKVFFHGGVAFTPYREQYKDVIRSSKMHYVETYNASEGYFGTQNDPADPAMLLMIDYGIFYEFIPLEDVGKENPRTFCLEEVELNKNYAMVISTSAGLWRYMIGDTVKFTSKNPYKFVITGRTKHFINAFGEELIVDNAERGLARACAETGAQVVDYSAAPVFMDKHAKCRHQWLIEFAQMPDSLEKFAKVLDDTLKEVNSDYEAKRQNNLALQPLEIIVARPNLFHDWLDSKGKLGGQHKVPRLSNTREYIEEMLELNR